MNNDRDYQWLNSGTIIPPSIFCKLRAFNLSAVSIALRGKKICEE